MRHAFAYLLLFLTLITSCDRPRKIPERTLATIYAEMFVADQWISVKKLSKTADTSWVYEPIFNKYGYDSRDYVYSTGLYIEDPGEFAKVLERTRDILRERLADTKDVLAFEVLLDGLNGAHESWYRPFSMVSDSLLVPTPLGVEPVRDIYNPYAVAPVMPDSIYLGPELIAVDTIRIARRDSIKAAMDSLARLDSLCTLHLDSLRAVADSIGLSLDSLLIVADSTGLSLDSLLIVVDSTDKP